MTIIVLTLVICTSTIASTLAASPKKTQDTSFPQVTNKSDPSSDTRTPPVKYEPLYVIVYPAKYLIAGDMMYDKYDNDYIFQAPYRTIGVACPQQDDIGVHDTLQIIDKAENEVIPLSLVCDHQVNAVTVRGAQSDTFAIGFLIYAERIDPRQNRLLYKEIPEIQFIEKESRVVAVKHYIKFGKYLNVIASKSDTKIVYEKNITILGYDADALYNKENQQKLLGSTSTEPSSLVKLQLAPESDFFLDNHKRATRADINTTPIWKTLLNPWTKMELFIRKVAQVLNRVTITTGTANGANTPATPLLYLDANNNKLAVSKYLWKSVVYEHYFEKELYKVGILFIMPNDPGTKDQPTICQDIGDKMGWIFSTDPQQKKSIYACPLTHQNMTKLEPSYTLEGTYDEFNLHEVFTTMQNKSGLEEVLILNVYDRMKIN